MKFQYYLLLFLFFTISCQTTPKSDKKSADIEISLNKEFTISLKSNPSTGYSWKWMNTIEKSIAKQVGEDFENTENRNLVGVGGIQKFKFKAIKKGLQVFTFHYIRPWEKGAKPAEISTFEVEVK